MRVRIMAAPSVRCGWDYFLQHHWLLFCRLHPIHRLVSIPFSDYHQTHGGWGQVRSDLTFSGYKLVAIDALVGWITGFNSSGLIVRVLIVINLLS